ncbi:CCA tRNA nucleotidyltransferase [Pseudooceanicola sp.]|uniref:CCA tRNA nucleotidyltransferase n=1 Tax=Pseudooceanicola sp. TaxID=1914328 RepID=UPI00261BED89|nr:CCA tRNA nucleotidyltransferase [Pseudooceanicola sp.]MDF1854975.1 CCA tRNA nucleotidyltransferase [Pseudooceanicola sp.]
MTRIAGDWLDRPATRAVCAMLEGAGHQVFFVGGCVRDTLLGRAVGDIDLATDARPDQVFACAKAAGLNPVPTGVEHGTVTVVSEGIPHEVTTFRQDVETDGRRAVVAYADDIETDAQRRDFTMNALYADSRGAVLDPTGQGLADLAVRQVRFIEDPEARIREDYLRILRFFRFHAWYGDPAAGMDPAALAAIAANSAGIETLSAERIGHEMLRLLAAPDPAPAVAAMRQTGVLMLILPGADDMALAPLVHLEAAGGHAPEGLRRLAALGGSDVATRLRLSRAQARRLADIARALDEAGDAAALGYRHGAALALDALLIQAASLGQPVDPAAIDSVQQAAARVFPVSARDLMPDYQGPALGKRLSVLEERWLASAFALTRQDLLDDE